MAKADKDSLTDTGKTRNFVNVPMDDELKGMLEAMALEDAGGNKKDINLAALMRKLVFQEWERRSMVKKQIDRMKKKGLLPTH
jgi:hypothetical protein